jgi:hypothetical protein
MCVNGVCKKMQRKVKNKQKIGKRKRRKSEVVSGEHTRSLLALFLFRSTIGRLQVFGGCLCLVGTLLVGLTPYPLSSFHMTRSYANSTSCVISF